MSPEEVKCCGCVNPAKFMVGRMPACSFHAGFALSAMLSEGPEVVVKLAEPIEIFDLQGVF